MVLSREANLRRVRVQLDLAADEAQALDELKARCNLRSRADAVRLALGMLEWMSEQTAMGRQILAVGQRDVVHLAVPGLRRGAVGQHGITKEA